MAWTDPMTAIAGTELTAAQWNAYVRDNLNYLKSVIDGLTFSSVQLNRPGAQTIATSNTENIIWTVQAFDYGSWWSSGATITTPSSTIPAGSTSVGALVFARLQWEADATGTRRIRVLKNGVEFGSRTYGAVSGSVTDCPITEETTLEDGDTIVVEAYQTSGGNLDVIEANVTVTRIAPAA